MNEPTSSALNSRDHCAHWSHRDGRPLTGAGVMVAVIDSGWDRSCPDERISTGTAFLDASDQTACEQNDDDNDRLGHGTVCTRLILDVAPQASIIPVRVFGRSLETSPRTIEAAIQWCVARKVDVINLSLATERDDARDSLYLTCARAIDAGTIIVAAASIGSISYPSAFDNVLGVGMGSWSDPFKFTYADGETAEVCSPGIRRASFGLGGVPVTVTGASFAAPNISGIAALLRERWPRLRLAELRARLAELALEYVVARNGI